MRMADVWRPPHAVLFPCLRGKLTIMKGVVKVLVVLQLIPNTIQHEINTPASAHANTTPDLSKPGNGCVSNPLQNLTCLRTNTNCNYISIRSHLNTLHSILIEWVVSGERQSHRSSNESWCHTGHDHSTCGVWMSSSGSSCHESLHNTAAPPHQKPLWSRW